MIKLLMKIYKKKNNKNLMIKLNKKNKKHKI